jgi:hypothetical protein
MNFSFPLGTKVSKVDSSSRNEGHAHNLTHGACVTYRDFLSVAFEVFVELTVGYFTGSDASYALGPLAMPVAVKKSIAPRAAAVPNSDSRCIAFFFGVVDTLIDFTL